MHNEPRLCILFRRAALPFIRPLRWWLYSVDGAAVPSFVPRPNIHLVTLTVRSVSCIHVLSCVRWYTPLNTSNVHIYCIANSRPGLVSVVCYFAISASAADPPSLRSLYVLQINSGREYILLFRNVHQFWRTGWHMRLKLFNCTKEWIVM